MMVTKERLHSEDRKTGSTSRTKSWPQGSADGQDLRLSCAEDLKNKKQLQLRESWNTGYSIREGNVQERW
jgi:hypothetical protein